MLKTVGGQEQLEIDTLETDVVMFLGPGLEGNCLSNFIVLRAAVSS